MANAMQYAAAMKHLRLFILLLMCVPLFSVRGFAAQEPEARVNSQGIVEKIEISGVPEDDISQAVRGMMQKLVGQKFDQESANDLVDRIQIELPGYIATTNLAPGSDADHIKLIFVVEKSDEAPGRRSNINSRYIVEAVEVQGFDESKLSKDIRDDMRRLIGQRVDHALAERIHSRILRQLQPKYSVNRKMRRGNQPQHLIVIFEIKKAPWIPFAYLNSYLVYHNKQNLSFGLTAPIEFGNNRLSLGIVNDGDQLMAREEGYRIGYENVKLGTERVGIGLLWSSFNQKWKPSVQAAFAQSPDVPGIYRERNSFDPSVTFAFDPRVKLTAGVSITEVQTQYPTTHYDNANAAIASLSYRGRWETSGGDKHRFEGSYDLRATSHDLDSDFIYTRHFVQGRYVYSHDKSAISIAALAGRLSGRAPVFDRFVLGNTSTLRGWNKYDIAPLGGNRVAHGSIEYSYDSFHLFYDAGGVGDHGRAIQGRHSVGFGFGEDDPDDHFFVSIGIPIRSSHIQPTFMFGIRF